MTDVPHYRALALVLGAAVSLAGCGTKRTSACNGVPPPHTEHYVISEERAAVLLAAADGGDGTLCRDECNSAPHTYWGATNCSVGGPTDGGVDLTCEFRLYCR